MNLDIARGIGRQFELRRLQERRRHAEAKLLLESVTGSAGEDHGSEKLR
jgi:hypothetical protein